MNEGLQAALGVAAIVLAAVVTGALLPVLFEARATLRRVRRLLDEAEPRLQALAAGLDETQQTLKVVTALGAAVGPAVAAAVQGYQAARRNGHGAAGSEMPGEASAPRGAHDGG